MHSFLISLTEICCFESAEVDDKIAANSKAPFHLKFYSQAIFREAAQ